MDPNVTGTSHLRRASLSLPINLGNTKLPHSDQEEFSSPKIILDTNHFSENELQAEVVPLSPKTGCMSIADVDNFVRGSFNPNTIGLLRRASVSLPKIILNTNHLPENELPTEIVPLSSKTNRMSIADVHDVVQGNFNPIQSEQATLEAAEKDNAIANGKKKFSRRTSEITNQGSLNISESENVDKSNSWIGYSYEGKQILDKMKRRSIHLLDLSTITENQAPLSNLSNSGNTLSRLKEDIRENSPKTESPKSGNNSPRPVRRISRSLTPKHSPKHSPNSTQSSPNKSNVNIILPKELSTGNVNFNIFHEDEALTLEAYKPAQNPKEYDRELSINLKEILTQHPKPSYERIKNIVLSFCQESIKTLILKENLSIEDYPDYEQERISLLLDLIQKSGILFQDILPRLVAMRNAIAGKIINSKEITDFSRELYTNLQKLTTIEIFTNADGKMTHGKTIPPFLFEFKRILNWDCKQLQKEIQQHLKGHKKDYIYDPQIVKDFILEAVAGPWNDSRKSKEGLSTEAQKEVISLSKEQKKDHISSPQIVKDFINKIESVKSKESLCSEAQKDVILSSREQKKDPISSPQIKDPIRISNGKPKEGVFLEAYKIATCLEKWAVSSEGGLNKSTSKFTKLKNYCKRIADLITSVSKLHYVEHHCFIEHRYPKPQIVEPTPNHTNVVGKHKSELSLSTKSLKFAAFKLSGETLSAPFVLTVGEKEMPYRVNSTNIYQTSPATNPIQDVFRSFQDEKILPRKIVINNKIFYENNNGIEPLVNFNPTNSAGIQNPPEKIMWKWMDNDKMMNFLSNLSNSIYENGFNPSYRSNVREDVQKLKEYNDFPKLWLQDHGLKLKPPEQEELYPWLKIAELMTIPCGGIGIITMILLYPDFFPEYYPEKTAKDLDDKTAKDPDVTPKYHVTFPKGFLEHHVVIKNEHEYSVTQTNQYNICLKDTQLKLATLSTSLKNEPSTTSVNIKGWNSVFKVSCEVHNPEYFLEIMEIITNPIALSARSDIPSGLHYHKEIHRPRTRSKGGQTLD